VEISEVKVKLMGDRSDRLKAFCSVTIDKEFVIRDLKIIEGTNGMFVAMPSRKITDKCPTCSGKNHLRAKFCNECGGRLNENRAGRDNEGRSKLHADIAHPINSACRERMQRRIIKGYEEELQRSRLPGYKPSYDEELDEIDYLEAEVSSGAASPRGAAPRRAADEHRKPDEPVQNQSAQKASEGDPFGAGLL